MSDNLAKRYLEEGRIEQAFNVLNKDAAKLTKVIEDYLGVTHEQGKQVVRLPYYRPLSMLNPTKPHRRSEQNIIRQIFSGLTTLDENEQVQPDLAHTWETTDGQHWRFYLRPGVRFHNGAALQITHVIDSLTRLSKTDLFSHLAKMESPMSWVLDIHLSCPDWHLPLMLTESSAKILPPSEWYQDDFDLHPIGTGPYKVNVNNDKRLVLDAFDNYFGFRPLVDRVEVWVINEVYSGMVFPSLSHPIKPENPSDDEVKLDPGCTFLLLNRKSGLAQNKAWADYFCSALNAFNLFKLLPEEKIAELGLLPAFGLKPGWQHTLIGGDKLLPPTTESVSIAYYTDHPVFPILAKTIARILSKDGVSVKFVKYQHEINELHKVDIWLKPMGIGTERDDALVGWLLGYSDVADFSQKAQFDSWYQLVDTWRQSKDMAFPARKMGKSLVEAQQIIPLFHCWLGVNKEHCGALQNARCNALGWFDFSQVWVRPDTDDEKSQ